jgi:uncharacterized DUF497 family protein
MRFAWDENKRRRNIEERGLDFLRACTKAKVLMGKAS